MLVTLFHSLNNLAVTFAPHYNEWRDMRKRFVTSLLNSNRIEQFRRVRKDKIFRMVEKISKLGDAADEDASSKAPINVSEIAMTCVRRGLKLTAQQLSIEWIFFLRKLSSCLGPFFSRIALTLSSVIASMDSQECIVVSKSISKIVINIINNSPMTIWIQSDRKMLQGDLIDDLLSLTKAGYLTLDAVKATIMEIFIGTTDTSKVTIAMAMTLLMKNPEAMKKAQEEVRSVVKDKGFVDEDDIPRLEYLML
ncbi:hypothetical protein CUMW_261350 [Citrus unshiu]|uniref:Cytochrome P450 n=1 Tax=Citrus unshiu TaxID=55188 RepID=A0A2H5QTZ0_CITUN|nr:hypothetical protein CUMW_261350 [Citrus unshiu]